MAGLAAAWRLSEPGWRERFESITVYQRGWRLGGKGASSRGVHGRIEEHGLHIWLGSYENAFSLLRACYAELDRTTSDPAAPIRNWDQALIPADDLGLADRFGTEWLQWLGTFGRNDSSPGDPASTSGREMTTVDFVERALQLLLDFADSIQDPALSELVLSTSPEPGPAGAGTGKSAKLLRRSVTAAMFGMVDSFASSPSGDPLAEALEAAREVLEVETRPDHRRTWLLVSMVTAVVRGIITDKLVTDPSGFRAINDEDFGDWILRHGAHPDVRDYPLIRGVYDLVFGYADGDPDRPACAAGLMIFLIGMVLFEYKGAIFWKMTAGMGEIVIAPIYQVLRRRGVKFEFFHRLDALHIDRHDRSIEAISLGRQALLAPGIGEYDPLVRIGGLPVFPDEPIAEQLVAPAGLSELESHFGDHDDVEKRVLFRGKDFDRVILAVSLGMIDSVASEIIGARQQWRDMTSHVRTVATQAFQLWLRPTEPELGWARPGVTVSAYLRPFETWASMPQTLWAETWPAEHRPGTVAYFCGSLDAAWPVTENDAQYVERNRRQVYEAAAAYIEHNLLFYFPNAYGDSGFDWSLLVGNDGRKGAAAMETQHVSVNIDPSDRYVQSVPGSDKYRLRVDESGYENLVLAGDWTDCGMNAGCIEAAVMSGLQAANVLMGRGRFYRLRGYWLP
ncbi:MAG: FAD-dependent oxidoreductase [Mycobacterium sp.]|nr:FAD-dependent oxidoreductase [Mycobacterium sp.]